MADGLTTLMRLRGWAVAIVTLGAGVGFFWARSEVDSAGTPRGLGARPTPPALSPPPLGPDAWSGDLSAVAWDCPGHAFGPVLGTNGRVGWECDRSDAGRTDGFVGRIGPGGASLNVDDLALDMRLPVPAQHGPIGRALGFRPDGRSDWLVSSRGRATRWEVLAPDATVPEPASSLDAGDVEQVVFGEPVLALVDEGSRTTVWRIDDTEASRLDLDVTPLALAWLRPGERILVVTLDATVSCPLAGGRCAPWGPASAAATWTLDGVVHAIRRGDGWALVVGSSDARWTLDGPVEVPDHRTWSSAGGWTTWTRPSPDDGVIVGRVDGGAVVELSPLENGRPLLDPREAALSEDLRWIAFTALRGTDDPRRRLYVAPLDAHLTPPRRL